MASLDERTVRDASAVLGGRSETTKLVNVWSYCYMRAPVARSVFSLYLHLSRTLQQQNAQSCPASSLPAGQP